MRISSFLAVSVLSVVAAAVPAYSQPFSLVAQLPKNSQVVAQGGTLALAAPAIGIPLTAQLTFSYHPSPPTTTYPNVSVNIYDLVLSGYSDFSYSAPALPVTLGTQATGNASTFVVNLTYRPSTGNQLIAQFIMRYQETGYDPQTFIVNLVATAPDVTFSYVLPSATATPLSNGDTVPFPNTLVTTPVTTTPVSFIFINRGTAEAVLNSIVCTGLYTVSNTTASLLKRGHWTFSGLETAP